MSSSIKQIYASLEFCENSIKILIAEYFNSRFNVLKFNELYTSSTMDFRIIDRKQLINDLKTLFDNTSNAIGAKIEKVILLIPAYNFKRYPLRSSIVPESGFVTKKDVARAVSNSLKGKVDYDVMIINPMISKYTINGISTRRMPEKEACKEMTVDIDLLCSDKEIAYDYVSIVEECGVQVQDIVLNSYAIGKEASLFEESLKQNVISLEINRNCTYLSLFSKGRLVSSEVIFDGLNAIVRDAKLSYDIPEEDLYKLVKYDVDYDAKYQDDIVYAFNENNETITISTKELNRLTEDPLRNLVDKLITMSTPILEQKALIIITGEGQQMNSLVKLIKNNVNCEVRSYFPDTIGVRNSSLSALHGSMFAYNEKVRLFDMNVNCIDLLEYDSKIDNKEIDSEGETITTKIKNLFKQYVEREG